MTISLTAVLAAMVGATTPVVGTGTTGSRWAYRQFQQTGLGDEGTSHGPESHYRKPRPPVPPQHRAMGHSHPPKIRRTNGVDRA